MSSLVGQHIGKYRVTRQVGRGGMGTVYGAVDQTLHRDVALKVLNAGLDDPTVARRFRSEAIAVARLNHPGIATIYELIQHEGQWLMVMEFVRGETLEDALAGAARLPVDRAAELTMQLLAALVHAHGNGVVHRDLKPANIILPAGGGVKIMDFGIARIAGTEQLTSVGFTMGTPAYMAPEQVLGGDIDARTDLYAVGILLYQMVAGNMPFDGATAVQMAQARIQGPPRALRDVAPDLPEWLAQVLGIALQREPADRFQSAALFREAIRRGLAGVPIDGEISPPPASLAIPPAPAAGLHIVKGASSLPAPDAALLETQMPAPRAVAAPPATAAPARSEPADVERVSAPPAVSDAAAPPAPSTESTRPMPLVAAAAVAVVLVVAGLGWWVTRAPGGAAGIDGSASTEAAAAEPTGESPAAGNSAPETSAAPGASSSGAASRAPASSGSPVAAGGPAPVSSARNAGSGTRAAATATTPSPGRTTNAPRLAPEPPPPPADATPAVFRGVRAIVLTGRRAEERPAVLTFSEGVVRLFDDGGQVAFAEMPYGQVTAAAYTRARDPRWYPTLAGPPIDTDMPGGIFRGSQHWLALQSRTVWMIVRMNDNDRESITTTVTERLGLRVETLPPQ